MLKGIVSGNFVTGRVFQRLMDLSISMTITMHLISISNSYMKM